MKLLRLLSLFALPFLLVPPGSTPANAAVPGADSQPQFVVPKGEVLKFTWMANQVTSLCFGGENSDTLFAACGGKLYKRKLAVRGAHPWAAPTKPAPPRL